MNLFNSCFRQNSLFRNVFSPNTHLEFLLHLTSKLHCLKLHSNVETTCRLCDKQNIKFVPVAYDIYGTRQLGFNFSSPRLAEIKTKLTRSIYFVSNDHSFYILYVLQPSPSVKSKVMTRFPDRSSIHSTWFC
ncbi:hypothetical protein GQR58_020508 [Nymphon striatum]|nr:hypothetical protein GQR58_020508 [Nymphon striatum]